MFTALSIYLTRFQISPIIWYNYWWSYIIKTCKIINTVLNQAGFAYNKIKTLHNNKIHSYLKDNVTVSSLYVNVLEHNTRVKSTIRIIMLSVHIFGLWSSWCLMKSFGFNTTTKTEVNETNLSVLRNVNFAYTFSLRN